MNAVPKRAAGLALNVLLVGFQDQDNLGLRYLCSAVRKAGHHPEIVTFSEDPDVLITRARETGAELIGLSLIFQYMTPKFGEIIAALRAAGITAHITMGGHYPSFDFARVLEAISGLDSIVRFDGEITLAMLLNRLAAGEEWRDLDGLACRLPDGTIHSNRLRVPVEDLDALPWPERADIDYESKPLATASILGSRGCPWNCSFCSIRPFYELQGGKLRRLRRPENVVAEMLELYEHRGVSLFLFQDDDFLATGPRARRWAADIARLIAASGAAGRIAFKLSCRSDEVDEEVMRELMRGGLTHVYLGVESGDINGLVGMNKKLKPATHLAAGRVLKKLGLSFDFGFMLMDPTSTFASIRNNIDFLGSFVGDGWSIAPFCRMLPYAGTPVRDQLEQEGRLKGTDFQPDYTFLDPRLDFYYDWMIQTFHRRNFTTEGLSHILRYLNFEARLRLDTDPVRQGTRASVLRFFTARANDIACRVLRLGLDHVERTPLGALRPDDEMLLSLSSWEAMEEDRLMREITSFLASEPAGTRHGVDAGFDRSWTDHGDTQTRAGLMI